MSEPTAEDRAREIAGRCEEMSALGLGTDCLSSKRQRACSECVNTKMIAAALLSAEARGRAEERERCAKIASTLRDSLATAETVFGAWHKDGKRALPVQMAEAAAQAIRRLDAAAVSREEKR